jgi:hypothetical protein
VTQILLLCLVLLLTYWLATDSDEEENLCHEDGEDTYLRVRREDETDR